jgi:hypothetical protein
MILRGRVSYEKWWSGPLVLPSPKGIEKRPLPEEIMTYTRLSDPISAGCISACRSLRPPQYRRRIAAAQTVGSGVSQVLAIVVWMRSGVLSGAPDARRFAVVRRPGRRIWICAPQVVATVCVVVWRMVKYGKYCNQPSAGIHWFNPLAGRPWLAFPNRITAQAYLYLFPWSFSALQGPDTTTASELTGIIIKLGSSQWLPLPSCTD